MDRKDFEKEQDNKQNAGTNPTHQEHSRGGNDLHNPLTGEDRKSEEEISREIDANEENSGFPPGGGQPFTS